MISSPVAFPEDLAALDPVEIHLSTGRSVSIHAFRAEFNVSPDRSGMGLDRSYSAKRLVQVEKQSVFPEIACLSLFQHSGWHGVWSDHAHRKYFDKMPTQSKGTSLDTFANQAITRIAENNGKSKAGCWDLVLWENRTLVFVAVITAEEKGRAGLSEANARWLAASIRSGLSPSQFAIVTWTYRKVAARRRQKSAG
jgi:hypothetical protein